MPTAFADRYGPTALVTRASSGIRRAPVLLSSIVALQGAPNARSTASPSGTVNWYQ